MNLPLIPHDKANHAVYGAGLSCAVLCIAVLLFRVPSPIAAAVALALTAIVAAAKEALDATNRAEHTPDLIDFAATLAGGILVALPAIITWL